MPGIQFWLGLFIGTFLGCWLQALLKYVVLLRQTGKFYRSGRKREGGSPSITRAVYPGRNNDYVQKVYETKSDSQ